jgi:peptidoglycan-associated lipoprotein
MRHLVIAAAALPLILVSGPEGLSPKQAEACGAKVSVKGAKIARMRRLSNSSARQPIAAGPIGVSGRAAVNVGGDAGDRSPSASGGGETAARTPKPRKRPKADPVARNETPKEEPAATNPDLGRKTEEPTPKEDPPLAEPAPTPPAEKAPKGKFASHYFFGNASSSLTSQSTKKLKATARWLKANPDKSVVVEGHASTNGNHNANRNLSEKRAEAVKAQLVELGVDESRISVEAFGSDRPEFEPGASAKNRRVVIIAK